MKSYVFSILSAGLFVAGVSAQLEVNTPTDVLACTPIQITWTNGIPPFQLGIFPGATPDGTALETFLNLNSSPFTWTPNVLPNTSLDITLRDNSGAISQSAPFTVMAGASTSCVNSTAAPTTVIESSTSGSAATPTTGGTTTTGNTPATTSSSKGASSASGASGTTTSKAASSSGAAIANGISAGAVGVLGAAVAAMFV